ncbi:hypothetical protein ACH5RR_041425 [Cinchona calisaya]|uniref:F-box domain-containing protein n=1 Tax=Cinchona calisaya TaxID=153742 RepID=A0ABD2XYZ4_9GENT
MENLGVLRAALEEEENKEDPFFKRLPDELIISHILGKVSEAKSLCRCSLVSKKFSSLVYKTKNVSVKITFHIPIPQPKSNPEEPTTKYAAFPGKLVHVVTYPLMFVQNIALKAKEITCHIITGIKPSANSNFSDTATAMNRAAKL